MYITMGMFSALKVKKSLIEKSNDVISSFTTIVTKLTELNESLQAEKDIKKEKINVLTSEVNEASMQKIANEKVIKKIKDIIS